ncbi:hypothetical protein SKAU_G00406520 [Synaphobranchus kaupii]|uniref:Apolipoprotein A-IV n=1 Tax=Synaphobranchus kaupii TaxID=118154 RepID=A0A9Q1EA12_SYNKA|nr:hypothetical protein SKAU_G00406520 [Synaphobranchus kaupii]
MKVFVVLVLAVFTGCHGNMLSASQPMPQLKELVKDAFWDYVAKATHTAEETLQMVRHSELGQEVNAQITDSTDEAEQLKARLAKDLNIKRVQLEALKAALLQKSEELKESLEQSVKELQAQLEPHTEELKAKVDQHLQEFQKSVAPLAQSFQTQLVQKTQEIQQNLAPYGEDLREKLDPLAQDLKAQLTTLWESFTKKN